MWKMITGQALFQLTVTLILHFAPGPNFLNYPDDEGRSIVFNTFVWMQIFNEFNNRRLDNRFNIFAGIHRNWFFIGINCIMVGCQVAIAFVGGQAFSIVRIDGAQWAICIVVAALCLPWAVCVRLFPDAWFGVGAAFVGRPVLLVYRPLSRGWSRLGGRIAKMFKRNKTSEVEEEPAELDREMTLTQGVEANREDVERGRV